METVVNYIDMRASRGYVREYSPGPDQTPTAISEDDARVFLDMIRSDPIIATAFEIITDFAVSPGYDFYPIDDTALAKKEAEEAKKYFSEKINFDEIQENMFYSLNLYGNLFVEMVGDKPTEVHVLDSLITVPKYDKHGTMTGYKQKFPAPEGKDPEWRMDEVMYFRLKKIGSKVESYMPLEPINRNFSTYIYANNYLLQIFKNIPPRLIYYLKNASEPARREFIANLKLARVDPSVDLVARGEVGTTITNIDIFDGLFKVLKYLRQQILMITRVPPVLIGLIDAEGANRGNSEAQTAGFEITIKRLHQTIEQQINSQLMKKLGFNRCKFKYNPPSIKDEKRVLENANILAAMGMKKGALAKFLSERGIKVSATDFEEQTDVAMPKDQFPSRKREDKATGDMSNNVGAAGVSNTKDATSKMEVRAPIEIWRERNSLYSEEATVW